MLAIAHGGGALRGEAYTNSFEALDASYARGFRWFELDFKLTADGLVGCRHDWSEFGDEAPTLAGLRERFAGRFTPIDAEGLGAWMAAHPEAMLVTDVKEADQTPVLRALSEAGIPPERTVVQLFQPSEDAPVRDLGFPRRSIILYRYRGSRHDLHAFLRQARPEAIGMSAAQAASGLARRLPPLPVWVYTVNRPGRARHLAGRGVSAVFTDDLAPGGLLTNAPDRLFTYGTLRDPGPQRTVIGREALGAPDLLPGYEAGWLAERDAAAVVTSGVTRHLVARPRLGASIAGEVLTLTRAELHAADAYEGADYTRVRVRLGSGRTAWLYQEA